MLNLNALNPQQRLAVETIRGPVLILAGAGTGKTRVITCRIAHLINQGIPPGLILAVTFTNKAAREMQARIAELLPRRRRNGEPKAERPAICTFHSFCVRVLRRYIDRLGYKPNFVIFDETEQLTTIKKILSHISAKNEKLDPWEIMAALSRVKNGGAAALEASDPTLAGLVRMIQPKYQSSLHACNAVDFDDLLLLTLKLFREHPDVLQACRAQYQFIMVDEYQDTNGAQFELVHSLAKEHRNFCVVGDDDQSIYGWRGAEIANLLDLEKFFPEVRIIKLEQNYRSTSVILDAANAVIQRNARRRAKRLWSNKPGGEKILLHTFKDEQEEAQVLVEEIEFRRQIQRIPWSAQAILFRTNLQSRPIETELRKANVRYHLIGGQSFFDRREIRDLLAYLKFFLNPHDDISLLRIVNVPARGMSDTTMERLLAASQERKCSVFSAMTNPAVQCSLNTAARKHLDQFLALVQDVRAQLRAPETNSLRAWTERFLERIRYEDELLRSEKDRVAAENRVRNLREIVASFDQDALEGAHAAERLQNYLADLSLDRERTEKEPEGDAVTLITVHSCKGLEFPHVYLVGLEDGLFPHERSKLENTLDEERRLFYVAITRAMLTLTLSYCLERKKYGDIVPRHPSPFLAELPSILIEHAHERGKAPVTVTSGKQMFANIREMIG